MKRGKGINQTNSWGKHFPRQRTDSITESPRMGLLFTVVISHLHFDYFINLPPSLDCNLQKGKNRICFALFSLQHLVLGLAQTRCSENIWWMINLYILPNELEKLLPGLVKTTFSILSTLDFAPSFTFSWFWFLCPTPLHTRPSL